MFKNLRSVLVVEDDEHIREILTMFLTFNGLDSLAVNDAEQARQVLAERDFDLVLTDLVMPGMTGADLISWCRCRGLTLPMVLMTAAHNHLIPTDAIARCGNALIVKKPFHYDDLSNALDVADTLATQRLTTVSPAARLGLSQLSPGSDPHPGVS